jgi:putative lipoic acid-binding regulatory protein
VNKDYSDFIEKLEDQHTWPSEYMFKFIVPSYSEEQVRGIFQGHHLQARESSKGNYTSITVKMMINSTSEVIEIYEEAYKIKGVISL